MVLTLNLLFFLLFTTVSATELSKSTAFRASSFAGATTSAVFPVPNATNAASIYDSFFPEASIVGFAGPTPSMVSAPSS